jgi:hypothetical protein
MRWTAVAVALVGLVLLGAGATTATALSPVGSYLVSDGPYYGNAPPTYNCVEACAVLFGGSASSYSCSTVDSTINHQAFVDGWADAQFCTTPVSETLKKDTTYYCDTIGCAYSAYVKDHQPACDVRNFCFPFAPAAAAPALSHIPLAGLGVLLIGSGAWLTRRRTRAAA